MHDAVSNSKLLTTGNGGRAISEKRIIAALYKNYGNVSKAARAIGVTPRCIRNHLAKSPKLRAAQADAKEQALDLGESKLLERVAAGSSKDIHFFLNAQGRRRGYGKAPQQDNDGIAPSVVADLSKLALTEEQKIALLELARSRRADDSDELADLTEESSDMAGSDIFEEVVETPMEGGIADEDDITVIGADEEVFDI